MKKGPDDAPVDYDAVQDPGTEVLNGKWISSWTNEGYVISISGGEISLQFFDDEGKLYDPKYYAYTYDKEKLKLFLADHPDLGMYVRIKIVDRDRIKIGVELAVDVYDRTD